MRDDAASLPSTTLPTFHDLVHIFPAPALYHPPERALEDVQEVVVDPEADEHLDRELQHLARIDGGIIGKEKGSEKNVGDDTQGILQSPPIPPIPPIPPRTCILTPRTYFPYLCIWNAPYRSAHGHYVVVREHTAVPLLLQELPEGHLAVHVEVGWLQNLGG